MNWQPIETAPKDELILVARTKRMCGPCAAMNDSQEGWVTETPGEWVSIYTPSHWMPLPEAPDAKCRTCSGHGAVWNILTAGPCPDCTPDPVREVLTDRQITEVLWRTHLRWMEQCGIDTEGMMPTGTWLEHWLIYARAVERAALAAAPTAAKESP